MTSKQFVSPSEAATLVGVPLETLRGAITAGSIKTIGTVNSQQRFVSIADVERFKARIEPKPKQSKARKSKKQP